MPVKVDKNVPVPPRRRLPFYTLKVGESFAVPVHAAPSLRASASIYSKRLGKHFIVRLEEDGVTYRCWRDK